MPSPSRSSFRLTPDSTDAQAFVAEVQQTLGQGNAHYHRFLRLLIDYRSSQISMTTFLSRVSPILNPHPYLVLKFNAFLPEGWAILHPSPLLSSPANSTTLIHRRNRTRNQRDQDRDAEAYQRSLKFIEKVHERFRREDGSAGSQSAAFVMLLQMPREQADEVKNLRDRVLQVFEGHPDLCAEFDSFCDPIVRKEMNELPHTMDTICQVSVGETRLLSPKTPTIICHSPSATPSPVHSRSPTPTGRKESPTPSLSSSDHTISARSSPSTNPTSLSDSDGLPLPPRDVKCVKVSEILAPLPFYPALGLLAPTRWPSFTGFETSHDFQTPTQTFMDHHFARQASAKQGSRSPPFPDDDIPHYALSCNPADLDGYQFADDVLPSSPLSPGWVCDPPASTTPVIYPFGVAHGRDVRLEGIAPPLLQETALPAATYAKVVKQGRDVGKRSGPRDGGSRKPYCNRSVRGVDRGKTKADVGAVGDGRPRKDIRWMYVNEVGSAPETTAWFFT